MIEGAQFPYLVCDPDGALPEDKRFELNNALIELKNNTTKVSLFTGYPKMKLLLNFYKKLFSQGTECSEQGITVVIALVHIVYDESVRKY